ncbi:SDR family NAD(P)-dependent oxidoreductase [Thermodesulfobacteriota bacterium]
MSKLNYTLLTGASSGIGQAIAERIGIKSRLILAGTDSAKLDSLKKQLPFAEYHISWPFDLNEVDGIAEALKSLLDEYGVVVDSFIHCAGIVKLLPVRLAKPEVVQQVMNVNFLSAVQIVSALMKKSINHNALKNIIFLSSIYSERGVKANSIYAASKGALDAFMRALAIELAPEIRANSVLPGGVRTSMSERIYSDPRLLEQMKKDYPLRLGEVEDIVNMVEFLASDKASWITGQQLVVDGGKTAL